MMYGLIACGGESSRMGKDKSLLQYHDLPQITHTKDCIDPYCDQVFVSIRETQSENHPDLSSYLIDLPEYGHSGPIAALLTAFHYFPNHNFVLIGCDYPLLDKNDLKDFFKFISKHPAYPIAFYNPEGFYEPLLAYYPASCAPILLQNHEAGMNSLQRFLITQKAIPFTPKNLKSMLSVDTALQYDQVITFLSK
jgi:molybdopterin-guanine dinucleotide biosynthesis protein A